MDKGAKRTLVCNGTLRTLLRIWVESWDWRNGRFHSISPMSDANARGNSTKSRALRRLKDSANKRLIALKGGTNNSNCTEEKLGYVLTGGIQINMSNGGRRTLCVSRWDIL